VFRTIIVGFDGSDTARDGLALAMGLAKPSGASVVVAYVYDASVSGASPSAAAELRDHAEAVLAGARTRVSQVLDVTFRGVASSSPARGIGEIAVAYRADLIVLGSRRLGPAMRVALGGVSHKVVADAACAVALAPRGYGDYGGFVPQAIGVACSPTVDADKALAVAGKIAAATGGTVELVGTVEDSDGRSAQRPAAPRLGHAVERLIERSRRLDLVVVPRSSEAEPTTAISRVIDDACCPALVLPTKAAF
jgi:nucleotide-binding universal stress UspA family protein